MKKYNEKDDNIKMSAKIKDEADKSVKETSDTDTSVTETAVEEKPSKIAAWFDNFWYHYKAPTIIIAALVMIVGICTVQMMTKESYDYCVIYGGPQVLAVQDIAYIERAFQEIADDYNNDGEVHVALNDVVLLSDEEILTAKERGAVFNAQFIQKTRTEFYQQIIAGDAVICLLSPTFYEEIHASGGFMKLSDLFDEIPDSAYDDCGIILSKTDFGKSFNGIDDLPEDTVMAIRCLSTLSGLKGAKKTEAWQRSYENLFRAIVNYK